MTNTEKTSVTISAIRVSGSEFSVSKLNLPLVLAAGRSVALNVAFAPTATGWTGGKVTFTSNASNPTLQLSLAGSGVTIDSLTATPSSLSFGQVAVGTRATHSVVLTNARSWKETLKAFEVEGTGYSVSGPTLPLTLSPGQSVTLRVTFAPRTSGVTGGSVFISGPSLNVPFSGMGTTIGRLTISPATLNLGSVTVGSTGTQTGVLSATGGSVTITSVASSNSRFTVPGVSLPLTISAGQSVHFNVAFTPQSTGTTSAKLSFASNATNSLALESLAGTGAAPYVTLSWNPSTSRVVGYNVYRKLSTSASYTKINSTLDAITSYTDTTVALRQTYDYATTAVDAKGQESTHSDHVQVTIP